MTNFYGDRSDFDQWAYDYDPYEEDFRAEEDRDFDQWDSWQDQQSCW